MKIDNKKRSAIAATEKIISAIREKPEEKDKLLDSKGKVDLVRIAKELAKRKDSVEKGEKDGE